MPATYIDPDDGADPRNLGFQVNIDMTDGQKRFQLIYLPRKRQIICY
jgi:hypothetical protein